MWSIILYTIPLIFEECLMKYCLNNILTPPFDIMPNRLEPIINHKNNKQPIFTINIIKLLRTQHPILEIPQHQFQHTININTSNITFPIMISIMISVPLSIPISISMPISLTIIGYQFMQA